jgi:tetratricopeptide (TPR) repeat protein
MLGTAWLTLRQARAALANGHLDEAERLLAAPAVRGHKQSWGLLDDLTKGLVARAEQKIAHGDISGAWSDLLKLEANVSAKQSSTVGLLRQALVAHGLTEARVQLENGDPRRAAEAIGRLREQRVNPTDWHGLEDAAKDWHLAMELADRGEFTLAKQMFERVQRHSPTGAGVCRFASELEHRQNKFNELFPQLHEAQDQKHWRDVLQLSEDVLSVAPQHGEARKARSKAWKIEPETLAGHITPTGDEHAEPAAPPKRYHLWIDGIGGFLVCLAPRVSLGQASADGGVDVPLLADVSRFHAAIVRDNEGYLVESARPLQVNGNSTQKTTLHPGDRITLGAGCQLIFHRPVQLSATAKLVMQSGQRLPLSLDGVLLMAETLIIGPGPQAHVIHPDMTKPIVLYRQKDGLGVRVPGEFRVNGRTVKDKESLPNAATVSGSEFNFALEPAKNTRKG